MFAALNGDHITIARPVLIATAAVVVCLMVAAWWARRTGDISVALLIVAVPSLIVVMMLYRWVRDRLRGLAAVASALSDYEQGISAIASLRVASSFGPEAIAWNRLLDEIDEHRKQAALSQTRDSLDQRAHRSPGLDEACAAMTYGVLLVDPQLNTYYANGAAAGYLGTAHQSLPGTPLGELIDDEQLLQMVSKVACGQMRRRVVYELVRGTTEEPNVLRVTVRPVRVTDSAQALVMIEDVTQQRVADESRNAFIAQAVHELHTPLTNIKLYAEELLDESEDHTNHAGSINFINRETGRLERIISDMLCVAELEAGARDANLDDVPLASIITQLRTDYQPQADEHNVELSFDLPPKWPVLRGDRGKIEMVLHNLLGNAIKYTPAGGRICVTVEPASDHVSIEVADTGLGISPDHQLRIFERFYRADDKRINDIPGSGLGLALSRDVARLHGGDVTCDSELNKGSRFTFTLPTNYAAGE